MRDDGTRSPVPNGYWPLNQALRRLQGVVERDRTARTADNKATHRIVGAALELVELLDEIDYGSRDERGFKV